MQTYQHQSPLCAYRNEHCEVQSLSACITFNISLLAIRLCSSCTIFEAFPRSLGWISDRLIGASPPFVHVRLTPDQCGRDLHQTCLTHHSLRMKAYILEGQLQNCRNLKADLLYVFVLFERYSAFDRLIVFYLIPSCRVWLCFFYRFLLINTLDFYCRKRNRYLDARWLIF